MAHALGAANEAFEELSDAAADANIEDTLVRGVRYLSRNIVGHQYRGFFGISLYTCCISTTSAVRFLDGIVLVVCSMAVLSLTL